MPQKRNSFRLGLTVIVMFLLLFFCLLFLGGESLFKPAQTLIVVRFPQGSSMPEIAGGSLVTSFGKKVGRVIDSRIIEASDPQDPSIEDQPFLEVRAMVQADLNLYEDCRIIATGPPLGGKGTLEIVNRGVSTVPLTADTPVYGQPKGFQAILDLVSAELDGSKKDGIVAAVKLQLDATDERSLTFKIHNSIDDLNAITASISAELRRDHESMLLSKVHAGLDDVNRSLAQVAEMLEGNRDKIDSTLTAVDHATTTFDERIVAVLADELDTTRAGGTLTLAHTALEQLSQSLANINTITARSKRTVVLNAERIDELVENATQASIHLKNGIKDISLHPWKLFLKPSQAKRDESDLFNSVRQFAEAAAHLDDSTSRLKALLDANDGRLSSDDPDLARIRADLAKTVEKFNNAEKIFWSELQKR